MERHSNPNGPATQRHRVGRASQHGQPSDSVTCSCPSREKRICNVKGCGSRLSMYNPDPFCNNCRINFRNSAPYIHPLEYDGITIHTCPEVTE